MKRIVICYDGTGNKANGASWRKKISSNVVHLYAAVPAREREPVVAEGVISAPPAATGPNDLKWYCEGVGAELGDYIKGGLFGLSTPAKVRGGYTILAETYEPGDEIYIFGFSRGAFIANCLAHELADTGLNGTKNIPVKVLGVWETVPAVGQPFKALDRLNRELHPKVVAVETLPGNVENAFQALAIDEWRLNYEPVVWRSQGAQRTVEQLWFSGCHSDVGGGYPEDEPDERHEPAEARDGRPNALSRITLQWMQERAALGGRGVVFARAPAPVSPEAIARAQPRDPYEKMGRGLYARYMDTTEGLKELLGPYERDLNDGRYFRPLLTRGAAAGEDIHPTVRERVRAPVSPAYRPENRVAGPGGDRKLWEYLTRS